MALTFPNSACSYDPVRRRIRFSGYDGMFEVRFFVDLDVLAKTSPESLSGEAAYLRAFAIVRPTIIAAAIRVYRGGKGGNLHVLTLSDFR